MSYIVEGVLGGLSLAILLGPIFIVLVQTALERGGRAGLTVGTGIWTSDFLIVGLFYYFLSKIQNVVEDPDFIFWFGAIGGLIMIVFGIYISLRKTTLDYAKVKISAVHFLGYWTKGFIVNTINPFTFIFWLGFITSFLITRRLDGFHSSLLLGSILLTIIITDSLKVILAKLIRKKLNEELLSTINKIGGIAVSIFGLVIFYRCVFVGI
jgi:threonine/homoserine/homoserine lactone efflux protein